MAAVTFEQVTKIFPNGVCALRDFSLQIDDGELIVLVGPSGSGKTTTLRLIAGLESPTGGTLRIGEQVVNSLPPRRRDVAMVFQRHTLYPHLTVRHNLSFGLRLRHSCWPWCFLGLNRQWERELDEDVVRVARLLELEEVLDRKPAQLSGGQQQRVALGRAIVRRPAVFLLDEPLSHLDSRLRAELRGQLHLLHRRVQATMIHVTHDPVEAMVLADRVVVMDRGVAEQIGPPLEIYRKPRNRLVAGFFGWPPMNFLEGCITAAESGPSFSTADASMPVPEAWAAFAGRPLALGIRPEDLKLVRKEERPSCSCLGMEVALVELLGSATLMALRRGELQLIARLDEQSTIQHGQLIEVIVDMTRAHLFDGKTGIALLNGPAG